MFTCNKLLLGLQPYFDGIGFVHTEKKKKKESMKRKQDPRQS